MSLEKPRVVFDCMVYLQAAAREEGPAAACLRLAENHFISLFLSREILREVREVLAHPKIRERFSQLTDDIVTAFIERLRTVADVMTTIPKHFSYVRDVDDEPYINLAVEVGADYLVSRDKDLLDLMQWTTEDGREFQKRFRFLRIVDPVTFLNEMGQKRRRV